MRFEKKENDEDNLSQNVEKMSDYYRTMFESFMSEELVFGEEEIKKRVTEEAKN